MTAEGVRRPPVAVLACMAALLTAAVVALLSAGVPSVGTPVWAHEASGHVVPGLAAGTDRPELASVPLPMRAVARIGVPRSEGAEGAAIGTLVLVGLAVGVLAASGPRTLRPRAGSCQHGTRAPPSWS